MEPSNLEPEEELLAQMEIEPPDSSLRDKVLLSAEAAWSEPSEVLKERVLSAAEAAWSEPEDSRNLFRELILWPAAALVLAAFIVGSGSVVSDQVLAKWESPVAAESTIDTTPLPSLEEAGVFTTFRANRSLKRPRFSLTSYLHQVERAQRILERNQS